jgi:hypothetical protein
MSGEGPNTFGGLGLGPLNVVKCHGDEFRQATDDSHPDL